MIDKVIEKLIKDQIDVEHLKVDVSGNHSSITVVSRVFEDLSKVKRHQKIYECINEKIVSGEIHAVNILSFSPNEWKKN